MCTASFEKGYCYRAYATKTQTDAAAVSSSEKVGNNRLFPSIMRFPLPFNNHHQREVKEEANVRNIDDMRQQLQVPSSEWGAAPAMTTNRVGGMRRVRSANASRPRRGGGGGVGVGGDASSSSSARSHSQEARSSNNTVFGVLPSPPPPPSEQLPIPQCESTLLEIARNKSDHTDLRRMYDYATWNMYDRIVSARNKKRLSELENGGGVGDDDDDDDDHDVVASSSPSSPTKSTSTSSSSSSSPSKNNNKPSPTVTTAATSCNSSFTSNSPSQANNNKGPTSSNSGGGGGVVKTTTTTSAAVAAKAQHNHHDVAAANSTTTATTSTATTTTTKSTGNEAPLKQEKQHHPSTTKNTTTTSSSSNNATQTSSSSSLRHKLRSINKAFSSQDTDSSQGGGSGTSDVTLATTAESDYSSSSGCNSPATFPGCVLMSSSTSLRQRTMSQDYADDDHFIFQLEM